MTKRDCLTAGVAVRRLLWLQTVGGGCGDSLWWLWLLLWQNGMMTALTSMMAKMALNDGTGGSIDDSGGYYDAVGGNYDSGGGFYDGSDD
jgi:hypothetical protein